MTMDDTIMKAELLLRKVGVGRYFGSKSGYRDQNPKADPIFNSYLLTADNRGLLQVVSGSGDIEITSEAQMNALKLVCEALRQDLFIYHESTVHNETFNGRIFPYESWRVKVSYNYDGPTIEVRER